MPVLIVKPKKPELVKGWYEIGGKRIFFKSGWEAKFAFFLQWLLRYGLIQAWDYEPEEFWFEGVKRGTVTYKPDFRVLMASGAPVWVEVKGYMTRRSIVQCRRFMKEYGALPFCMVDAPWFRKWGYVDWRLKEAPTELEKKIFLKTLEPNKEYMDKKIKKVKEQNDKKMNKLIEEDKKRDKEMEQCEKSKKKKK